MKKDQKPLIERILLMKTYKEEMKKITPELTRYIAYAIAVGYDKLGVEIQKLRRGVLDEEGIEVVLYSLRKACIEDVFKKLSNNKCHIEYRRVKENNYPYIELHIENIVFTINHLQKYQRLPERAKFRDNNAERNPTAETYLQYNLFNINELMQSNKIYAYITHTGKYKLESISIKVPDKKNKTILYEEIIYNNSIPYKAEGIEEIVEQVIDYPIKKEEEKRDEI